MRRQVEINLLVSPELFRDMKPAELREYLGEQAFERGVKELAARRLDSRPGRAAADRSAPRYTVDEMDTFGL